MDQKGKSEKKFATVRGSKKILNASDSPGNDESQLSRTLIPRPRAASLVTSPRKYNPSIKDIDSNQIEEYDTAPSPTSSGHTSPTSNKSSSNTLTTPSNNSLSASSPEPSSRSTSTLNNLSVSSSATTSRSNLPSSSSTRAPFINSPYATTSIFKPTSLSSPPPSSNKTPKAKLHNIFSPPPATTKTIKKMISPPPSTASQPSKAIKSNSDSANSAKSPPPSKTHTPTTPLNSLSKSESISTKQEENSNLTNSVELTKRKTPRTSSSLGHNPPSSPSIPPRPASTVSSNVRKTAPKIPAPLRPIASANNLSTANKTKIVSPNKKSDTLKIKLTTSVKPIKIVESDLSKEFQAIQAVLQSKNQEDWSDRHKSLLKLEAIILGGATEFPSFSKEFEILKRPLAVMVSDLRSILVKESCVILCLLAKRMGASFNRFLPYYIPELLKQSVVSVRIIADSTDICIKTLLKFTQYTQIKDIIEGCRDTHSILLRNRCIGYVHLMLSEYADTVLEKIKSSLAEVIPPLLSDASADVRTEARACYTLFSTHFPEDGKKLFDNLDPNVQKYLQRDISRQLFAEKDRRSSNSSSGDNSKDEGDPIDLSVSVAQSVDSEDKQNNLETPLQNSDVIVGPWEHQTIDFNEEPLDLIDDKVDPLISGEEHGEEVGFQEESIQDIDLQTQTNQTTEFEQLSPKDD